MLFRIFVALALIALAQSGKTSIPKGMVLEWSISDEDAEFTFTVPNEVIVEYQYITLAYKDTDEGLDTVGLDGVLLLEDKDMVRDIWTEQELTKPRTDRSVDVTDDIEPEFAFTGDAESRVYTWSRPLNTGDDIYDIEFVEGENYYLHYAFGLYDDEHDIPTKPAQEDTGYVEITFSEDFDGTETVSFLSFK